MSAPGVLAGWLAGRTLGLGLPATNTPPWPSLEAGP
jgi:hypothetical protein